MTAGNILELADEAFDSEILEDIVRSEHVRIERILSKGQASPEAGWYDQDENEWVVVLQGRGRLVFDDGTEVELDTGSYMNIPAHKKHRVAWTDPDRVTIWLAVFYT